MRRTARFTRLSLLFAPLVLLAACEISAGDDEEAEGTRQMMSPADVDAAVAHVRPQYIQTFASGARAATGLPALYTADAVYSDPEGQTYSGQAAIRQAFAEGVPTGSTIRLESFGAVGSGDLVVDMGGYTVETPQADGAPLRQHGRYMVAIQRMDDGTWKIVRHLSSQQGPGAQATADSALVRPDITPPRDTARRDTARAGTPDTTTHGMDTMSH